MDWLDDLISFCLDTPDVKELPMPTAIPETCFTCGYLLDDCNCESLNKGWE